MRDIGENKRVIRTEKKSCGCSKNRVIDNTYKMVKANFVLKKKEAENKKKEEFKNKKNKTMFL